MLHLNKNIKILDFGIAKMIDESQTELTQTGLQMGTPMYMSPEQVKDVKRIDKRSDIYSLGVILFYLLERKPPYDKRSVSRFEMLNKIVNESLPPLTRSVEFNEVIRKATEKDPQDRFTNCQQFQKSLKDVAFELQPNETKFSNSKGKKILTYLRLTYVLISLIIIVYLLIDRYSNQKTYSNLINANNIEALVIPKSTYVLQGRNYEAEVLIAAPFSTPDANTRILEGVDTLTEANIRHAQIIKGDTGLVKLDFPTSNVGLQKYAGIIEMVDPATNRSSDYHFKGSYIVAPPALTVTPLKMNVLYIGIDNPVSISAPGIPAENIQSTVDQGVLKRDGEGQDWIIRINKMPKGVNKAYVSASASIDGEDLQLGRAEFRVKRVPTPTAEIAGKNDGQIDKNLMLAAGAIIPNIHDFEFEIYYDVTGFTFATIINGDWITNNVRGSLFTDENL